MFDTILRLECDALAMYFYGYRESDQFAMEVAIRQLEFAAQLRGLRYMDSIVASRSTM